MFEQIFMSNKKKKKEQILFSRLCVHCDILLSRKHMDWKGMGSEVYLRFMEGENICDIETQQLFWKTNTKKKHLDLHADRFYRWYRAIGIPRLIKLMGSTSMLLMMVACSYFDFI